VFIAIALLTHGIFREFYQGILMTNNDILRRIRYTFDFNDSKMIAIFGLADHQVTRAQISDWLKKDDDPAFQECSDARLAVFLNGLINDRRGKKEGISKHELSAFFRNPDHKHYRNCKDQVFRNFLNGIQLKYRDN
jgi:uncharacterized protein YehS (DUF1456 family)